MSAQPPFSNFTDTLTEEERLLLDRHVRNNAGITSPVTDTRTYSQPTTVGTSPVPTVGTSPVPATQDTRLRGLRLLPADPSGTEFPAQDMLGTPGRALSSRLQERATTETATQTGQLPYREIEQIYERSRAGGEAEGYLGIPENLFKGFISGLNEAIAYVPDLVIDSTVQGLKAAGIVPEDANIPRNMLSRIINAGDYETIKTVAELPLGQYVGFGQGERIGWNTPTGRIGQAAGEVASFAVPSVGVARLTARGYQGAQDLADVTRQQLARSTEGRLPGTRLALAEQWPGRYLQDPTKFAAWEAGAGAAGGAWMQGWEEAYPGSGLWSLAVPMAGFAAMTGAFKNAVTGMTKYSPSGKAFSFFRGQTPDSPPPFGNQAFGDFTAGVGRATREAVATRPFGVGRSRRDARARQTQQEKVDFELQLEENAAHLARTEEVEAAVLATTGRELELSPGRASGSAALLREEANVAARLAQQPAAEYRALQQQNAQIMSSFVENKLYAPIIDPATGRTLVDANGDAVWGMPSMVIDVAQGRLALVQGNVANRAERVTQALRNLSGEGTESTGGTLALTGLEGGQAAAGRTIRQQVSDLRQAASDGVDRFIADRGINRRKSVGSIAEQTIHNPDGTTTVVPGAKEQLLAELGMERGFISYEGLHKVVRRFLDFDFPNNQIRFQDWRNFRVETSAALSEARGPEKRHLQALKVILDNIKNGPAGHFGRASDDYREFSAFFDETMILPFEEASIRRVTRTGSRTRPEREGVGGERLPAITQYVRPDEDVALSFLDNSDSANAYMRMVDMIADPEAKLRMLTTMRDVIFDQARNSSGVLRDGVIQPGRLDDYVRNNRATLENLRVPHPITGQEVSPYSLLGDISNRATFLIARQARVHGQKKAIDDQLLNRAIQSVSENYGFAQEGREAILDSALDAALAGNAQMLKQLANSVRRGPSSYPGAQEALNRAIFERLFARNFQMEATGEAAGAAAQRVATGTGSRINTPIASRDITSFAAMLGKNETGLRTVMGDDHFDDMLVALDGFDRVFKLGQEAGSGLDRNSLMDKFGLITGVTPQGWSARMINMLESRVSPRTTAVWIGAQAWRAGENRVMDKMIEEVITNPNMARALSRKGPGAGEVNSEQANEIRRLMFGAGIVDPSSYLREELTGEGWSEVRPTREFPPDVATTRYPLPTPEQVQEEQEAVEPPPPPPVNVRPPNALPQAYFGPETTGAVSPSPPPRAGADRAATYSSLFPNDPLGQAVAERDRSGIMSLLG